MACAIRGSATQTGLSSIAEKRTNYKQRWRYAHADSYREKSFSTS